MVSIVHHYGKMLMEYTLNIKAAKLNFSLFFVRLVVNMDHGNIKFLKLCFRANIWIYMYSHIHFSFL